MHLGTSLILTVAAGVIVGLNIVPRPQADLEPALRSRIQFADQLESLVSKSGSTEYGWPCVAYRTDGPLTTVITANGTVIPPFDTRSPDVWLWQSVVANAAIAALGLCLLGGLLEAGVFRRSRRRKFDPQQIPMPEV
jgi:hypothetical protein